MLLALHSDASYLSEPEAKSRAAGHFFLGKLNNEKFDNGAIMTLSKIIKHVMLSASEVETAALFYNCKAAAPLRVMLEEMGHPQPKTPMQTDNSTAMGVVANKIQPKRTKAMDMIFHWLRCRDSQGQFRYYWMPGAKNWADHWTKHHSAQHHRDMRAKFLTDAQVLKALREANKENRPPQ